MTRIRMRLVGWVAGGVPLLLALACGAGPRGGTDVPGGGCVGIDSGAPDLAAEAGTGADAESADVPMQPDALPEPGPGDAVGPADSGADPACPAACDVACPSACDACPTGTQHALPAPSNAAPGWVAERIADGLDLGDWHSRPAIAVRDGAATLAFGGDGLNLARGSDDGFAVATIDDRPAAGLLPGVAMDAAGRVHAAYADPMMQRLLYAREVEDGGFDLWIADADALPVGAPAVATRADGVVRIAYGTVQGVRLATCDDGGCTRETVAFTAPTDTGGAIVAGLVEDATGAIHVAWVGPGSPGNLYHAVSSTGGWSVSAVGTAAGSACLVLGAGGVPNLFHQGTRQDVRRSWFEAGQWKYEDFDSPFGTSEIACAVDGKGAIVAAVFDDRSQTCDSCRNLSLLEWTAAGGLRLAHTIVQAGRVQSGALAADDDSSIWGTYRLDGVLTWFRFASPSLVNGAVATTSRYWGADLVPGATGGTAAYVDSIKLGAPMGVGWVRDELRTSSGGAGGWTPFEAPPAGDVESVQAAIDAAGRLHVAWTETLYTPSIPDPFRYPVHLATRNDTGWTMDDPGVENRCAEGRWFALDTQDRPCLLSIGPGTYVPRYGGTSTALSFSRRGEGGWTKVTVVDSPGLMGQPSFALRGDDPVLAYVDNGDSDIITCPLYLAEWKNGTFNRRQVDPEALAASGFSLAVDGAGTAHVAYFEAWKAELRYAAFPANGGGGVPEVVDATVDAGRMNAIAAASDGTPVLAYGAPWTDELRVATRSADGHWTIVPIATRVNVGRVVLKLFGDAPRVVIDEGYGRDVVLLRPGG